MVTNLGQAVLDQYSSCGPQTVSIQRSSQHVVMPIVDGVRYLSTIIIIVCWQVVSPEPSNLQQGLQAAVVTVLVLVLRISFGFRVTSVEPCWRAQDVGGFRCKRRLIPSFLCVVLFSSPLIFSTWIKPSSSCSRTQLITNMMKCMHFLRYALSSYVGDCNDCVVIIAGSNTGMLSSEHKQYVLDQDWQTQQPPPKEIAVMMSGRLLVKYIKSPSNRMYVVTCMMSGDCSLLVVALCVGAGLYGCDGVLALCSLNSFCSNFSWVCKSVPTSRWCSMLIPRNQSHRASVRSVG